MPVFRFAPSPNGLLHLGHAYSALLNAEAATAAGGRFLLRIEDIDRGRSRPEFVDAIFEDVAWLGLAWEEPVRRQSEHLDLYARTLSRLVEGGFAYPCFCSRAEIARRIAASGQTGELRRDPDGASLYPGTCRHLPPDEAGARVGAGEPHALRLDMAASMAATGPLAWREHAAPAPAAPWREMAAEPAAWGDVIIARRDAPASYHVAVVVDDALQGVTQVVRGSDLRQATAIHRVLQALLGLPAPGYHHHKLILDEAGRKLSKSMGSASLRGMRAAGMDACDIRARLGLA